MNKKSYLQKLAREGNSVAQNQLGRMYFWGQSDVGISQSYKMAIRWYRLSAAQGNDNALYSLGWAYKFGEGVSQNYEMALKYALKALEFSKFESSISETSYINATIASILR